MDPTAPGNENNANPEDATQIASETPPVDNPVNVPETINQVEQYPVQELSVPVENPGQPDQILNNPPPAEPVPPVQETGQNPPDQIPTPGIPSQDAAASTPQVFTTQVQSPQDAMIDSTGKKSRKPILFLLLAFFLILLLTGLGGLTYAVAYEKIKLENNPDLQKKISYFVMELPFMPKTPKYLLAKSALAHQDITKQSFDISMAIDSADLSSSLGLANLDVQAKGAFDYSDPKNVFGNLELFVTKDFNIELRKKDEMLYFKLNKLPSFLFAFLGINSASLDPILNKWVAYDTTPLDTEARTRIQKDREVDPLSEEFIDKNFEKFLDEEVLSKMRIEKDEEEGHAVYKIALDADSVLIDHLGKKIEENSRQKSNYVYPQSNTGETDKLSDFVKRLRWEIFIDKESYFTRKVIVSIDLEYDSSDGLGTFYMGSLINPAQGKNNAKIALAAKFDKFGEAVIVESPQNTITIEEFTDLLSKAINEIYGGAFTSTQERFGQANDATRKSHLAQLRAALEMYRADCGNYPSELSDMTHSAGSENCQYQSNVGSYIMIIPMDPDGSSYYYQAAGESYSLCANLEIAPTSQTPCPDPSFNYHLQEP